MNLALVGCGYVAEFYVKTLVNYPELHLVGAFDRDAENLQSFRCHFPGKIYASLDELLADPSVTMVLNLTNPRSHHEVTRRALEADKHVYSEKPLAMDVTSARELLELAERRNLRLGCAPCSLLSETAQTVAHALRNNLVGKVRLVYANYDDGMIAPHMSPWNWRNEYGAAWPARDEFEVGCTYEHAGYVLTWLAAFFGPAKTVTAFASCQLPDKGVEVAMMAPDFSVACIEYGDGVVARVTCSLVAPKDKSLTIIGDDGVLSVVNVRDDACPVYLQPSRPSRRPGGLERSINVLRRLLRLPGPSPQQQVPLVRRPPKHFVSAQKPVDFGRGPAELAGAIREERPCRLSPELALHIVEIIEAMQYPERFSGKRAITSSFVPITPLPVGVA